VRPNARASVATPVAIAAFGPRSRCFPAIVPLSPKARGTYHLPLVANAASPAHGGWGGGGRPHGIHFQGHHPTLGGAEEKMVRAVADRAFLPAKSLFEQVGNMMILTGKT